MAGKSKVRVFVPLTKVDEEQRLVYGRITQEVLDKANEVMDYESSKPLFEKWSNDIHTASNGLSKGNVRVMHGLTAAGKLTELNFDDGDKAIDVCAKIVDDAEWNKVTEGVYTGFSVGGSYAKRWTETIDGEKVKKFTASPNEVSIVDNPCVPSACFSMFKADGSEEQVAFKVENDDEAWPDFAKADEVASIDEPVKKEPVMKTVRIEPTNSELAAKATELSKAANDGSDWMSHLDAAREILTKEAPHPSVAEKETEQGGDAKADEQPPKEEEDPKPAEKVTPAGVMQKWNTSDGQAFEKKDDAVAHELSLTPPPAPTEADLLKARLAKAIDPEEGQEELPLLEDFDRLGKVLCALETPFEDGQPKLEKGLYRVSRFADLLGSFTGLAKTIQAEGKREKDEIDTAVAADMKKALSTLSESFKKYTDNQITELLAGIDDDTVVECYDYYCAAATADPENQLAKDVCSVLDERREPSRELRETMSKAFGITGPEDDEDDGALNPSMQKRFDELTKAADDMKKVAEDAITKVEELTKRVTAVEDTPLPRAPRNVALLNGDGTFLGKSFESEEDKVKIVHDMLKAKGPDALALELIKASQASGGHTMSLRS